MTANQPITELLEAHHRGEAGAFDRAVALVYDELRRVARGQRRRAGAGSTLNTTAIVHEAYFKLLGANANDWSGREHFLAVAATAMRQVAVDYARSQRRLKRGGDAKPVELDESIAASERQLDQVLAVDQALQKLGADKPDFVRVVECRFFAGMTDRETADALGMSERTVQRSWRGAKDALRVAMSA